MITLYFLLLFSILLVTLIPIFLRVEGFGFNCLTFLVIGILFQVVIRNVLIYLGLPDLDYINNALLLNHELNYFLASAIINFIFISISIFTYIFIRKQDGQPLPSLRFRPLFSNPHESFILFFSIILLVSSVISLYIFLTNYNFSLISSYRGITNEIRDYSGNGYLRAIIGLTLPLALIALAYTWISRSKKYLFKMIFIISSLVLFSYAFLTSSRAIFLTFFIGCWAMMSISKKKLGVISKTVGFSLMIFIVLIITSLRTSEEKDVSAYDLVESLADIPLYLIVNQSGVDIIKFQHLMNHVQEKTDYRYGELTSNLILMPVPRTIWSSKPVNIDTQFGMAVYGSTHFGTGGIPPGIFGEFFWDYWWPGVLIAAILTGIILGFLDKLFFNNSNSIFIRVIFSGALFWTGISLLGSGLVSTAIGTIVTFFPLFIIFTVCNVLTFNSRYKIKDKP